MIPGDMHQQPEDAAPWAIEDERLRRRLGRWMFGVSFALFMMMFGRIAAAWYQGRLQ